MEDDILEGDEAYGDPLKAGRRRVVDHRTFHQPIRAVGTRRCAILREEDTVGRAVEAMRGVKIGSVLVTGPDGRLTGIFTERDVLNKIALGEKDPKTTPLREVMRANPDALTLDDGIGYALRIMSHGGFRRVPLVDRDGRPVGIVSVRDIVDFIVDLFPDEILTLPPHPRARTSERPEGG